MPVSVESNSFTVASQVTGESFGIETTAILSAPGAVVVVNVVTVVAVVVGFGTQNFIVPIPVSISFVSHLDSSQHAVL